MHVDYVCCIWAIPEKIQTGGFEDILFRKSPCLEIPDRKLNPWIFHKIVLDTLEIPRPKTKTPGAGNSTLFFLGLHQPAPFEINYTPCHF